MIAEPTLQTSPSSMQLSKDENRILREQILVTVLRGCSVLGLAIYALVFVNFYPRQLWAILGAYTFCYLWLVAITLIRKLPYNLRVYSFLVILYALGLGGLLDSGLSGDGKAFLLVFSAMACLLVGLRAGIVTLAINILTMAGVGWAMSTGRYPLPPLETMANSKTPTEWMASAAILLMVGGIIVLSMSQVLRGLGKSLDQSHELVAQMTKQQADLEQTIEGRTDDLKRRLIQLRTASEIIRNIGAELNPQTLLNEIVNLVQERFGLYYVGVFLLDESGKLAVLKAGTGEAGAKMIADHHQLQVGGSSMIGWSILNRNARIALDVGQDAVHFNNPNLPLTRSEMALPLVAREKTLGALTIQSTAQSAFDEDDIMVLQGIADILATALENGRLFQEAQSNLDEIESLHRQYLAEAWAETEKLTGGLQFNYENKDIILDDAARENIQIPLVLRDQVIGQVTLETSEKSLTEEDMAFIDSITTQTTLALENARLLEETQRRAVQEQSLNELSMHFSRAFKVEDILKIAVEELGRLPSVAEAAVILEPALDTASPSNPGSADPTNN